MESFAHETSRPGALRAFYIAVMAFSLLGMSALVKEAIQPHDVAPAGTITIDVVGTR